MKRIAALLALTFLPFTPACTSKVSDGDATPTPTVTPTPSGVPLKAASKSSTISISDDDLTVVMANPDDDSISTFSTIDNQRIARVVTGDEPGAVVIHPDNATAFVANRAASTVVKVTGINGAGAAVSGAPVSVGSEPTGLALSPSGARLFVAEWAEGRISVIDTATMTVSGVIDAPLNPRGISVTNDGDADDSDELLVVPEFFGEPVAGAEGTDSSRNGRVRLFNAVTLADAGSIAFAPRNSGFEPVAGQGTVFTSPNQLFTAAVQGPKIYVTSISASPKAPSVFNGNVYPVVYVGDLTSKTEDLSNVGTANLAQLVNVQIPAAPRFFLADIVDLDFIGTSNVAYVLSQGGDVLQRVVYDTVNGITLGSTVNKQIDLLPAPAGALAGCQNPSGVVAAHGSPRAYVNCRVNRRLGVVDLSAQALLTTIESSSSPVAAEEISQQAGRRFFFTGRGRWSKDAWSSCGSCHPDGLTDNMTWIFAAGPRQSTSLDGSFSHGPGVQKQRIFNWTGIFDEVHDFERNTRGTSGGLGAITSSPTNACGTLTAEVADALAPAGLQGPLKELQDDAGSCTSDWDKVEDYMRIIRPPHGRRALDPTSVARGATLFGASGAGNNGDCVKCHGGSGFTVSRRFWGPSTTNNGNLANIATAPFVKPAAIPASWIFQNTAQIAPQPAAADNTGAVVQPGQVACVLRAIDTFGIPGDVAGTDLLEKNAANARAQGKGGFNVPSLYGLQVGAPFLHHGQAASLEALFADPKWNTHLIAGNQVFLTTGDVAQQRSDLVNYLLSIDETTAEQALTTGFEACPDIFPAP